MLCQKCQKEKPKEDFKRYDYGWRFVYSGCCNECQKGIVKRRKLTYKEQNQGSGLSKLKPDLFCKICKARFNGILNKKRSINNNKLCEECYQKYV